MNTVLMVAYHYPPEGSSSGVQRTLKFSQYLARSGWRPVVLTAHPRAYTVVREDQMGDIPATVLVWRAFALDAAKHLAWRGRYVRASAMPDRWAAWWIGAVVAGMRLIRKHRPQVLWSTYPIATAHLIGDTLHRLSSLPWVADFRDSMTEDGYPPDPKQWAAYRWVEKRAIAHSARAVFTTPGARRMYEERYPEAPRERFAVIANGYDEESFREANRRIRDDRSDGEHVLLVHSGSLYPVERDPRCFYAALSGLQKEGRIAPENLRIVLRATGHDEHHRRLIAEYGIENLVSLEPALPYREALREMLGADGLLIFQASNCNHQIPAKIYEYLRARRPILGLTDPRGDTADVLRNAGLSSIVPLDDEQKIRFGLLDWLHQIREGEAAVPATERIAKHSREARTRELASLLDEVVGGKTAG